MGVPVISSWARAARFIGTAWLAVATATAACDTVLASRSRDPQAMFGGHALALGMLWLGVWVAGAVLLCGLAACVQGYRSRGVRAGWRVTASGVAGVVVGCGLLFWSFVR